MKSEEYWNDAALRREIAVQTGTNYTGEEILKLYDEALSDIDTEIQKIKINFQKRFGIDNETAEYFLTQAQQEDNLKTLIKSLEYAPDEQARQDILAYIRRDGLSVRAYAARKERYEAVKAVIYARIKKVAVKEIEKLSERLQAVYKESYYGVIDDSAKQFDVGINFAILNENAINAAVSTKWHGKQFSERVWDNTDRLATTAQNLVVKSLMSGEAWSKTAEKLSTAFQVEKYNATRLIHTESSHIHAMADLKAYEDIGAEQYRYLATLDYRTCERCQQWDNMVLPLSEAREGYNYPVLHPLCRCTTTIAVDLKNRRARDPLTGKNDIVDGSVNYSEWYNSLSDEQKTALKLSKRKDSNKTSDKLQHAKYVKVLGTKEVPRSFDKWQELKYNDSEKYNELKSLYRSKITVANSEKRGIINYAKVDNLFSYKADEVVKITPQDILDDLSTSKIGRETLEYLENLPQMPNLNYIDAFDGIRAEERDGVIIVYLKNCKDVKTAACSLIHECTHRKYGIGQSQWAESQCVSAEILHRRNRDYLTMSEKRMIVKAVKEVYPEYNWRKGGTVRGRKI